MEKLELPQPKTKTNSLAPPLLTLCHIIFDNNIQNDSNDGMIAVCAYFKQSKKDNDSKSEMLSAPLNGYKTISMQRIHLSQVPTLESVACWPHLPAPPKITQHFFSNKYIFIQDEY